MSRLLIVLALAASACSGTPAPTESAASSGSTSAATASPGAAGDPSGATFTAFWSEFRQALLAPDFERAAAMTRFPLEARGELDADPVTHIDRRAFDDAMRRMLAQDSGRSATPESVAVFLAQSSQLEPTAVTPDGGAARVADFQFERVDSGWRLTRIYLQGERR